METISYQIGLDLLTKKAENELDKIEARIQKIDNKAIIDFKYNGNFKELNAMLQRIEKKVPELPVDFRIGVLNEALTLDKGKVNKIQDQINSIIGDPVQTIKKLSSEMENFFRKFEG